MSTADSTFGLSSEPRNSLLAQVDAVKFAFVGVDDQTREFAAAVLCHAEHRVVAFACLSDEATTNWREALAHGDERLRAKLADVDEVEFARVPELAEVAVIARAEKGLAAIPSVRNLARAGMRVVVSHPLSLSPLDLYELEMIADDAGGQLVPLVAMLGSPELERTLREVTAATSAGGLAPIEQVAMQRYATERTRQAVLATLAGDVVLLRALCGEIESVSAVGPDFAAEQYPNLNVQMAGSGHRLARWSVEPSGGDVAARLTIVGEDKSLQLERASEESSAWRRVDTTDDAESQPVGPDDWVDRVIRSFPAADANVAPVPGSESNWRAATRAVEIVEGVQDSLRKGRTIKLHAEEQGEEAAFKGTMATLGCGLLLGATMLLCGLALAEQFAVGTDIPVLKRISGMTSFWPYAVLVVLVVFLLLQLLRFVIPQSGTHVASQGGRRSNDDS